MVLQKKDFIEIEFTGKVKGGEIFDSTRKEELAKMHAGHDHPIEAKPFVFSLGQGMFLKALDDFLIGKKPGEYEIELEPEKAFGKRDPKLITMIPMKVFREQKVNPVPGIMFNFDGKVAKILTVSGGRVMADFNNSLAGKIVEYKIRVLRKIDNLDEKIKALNEFFFKKEFKFEIKEKKLIMEVEKPMVKFVEMFKDKFKEILGLELEIKEIEEEKKQPSEKH
jgi:FKBP-type peptidyl-prolyl cis-trans isomerase 2